ncbi:hypothetical protein [Nocardiopsis chromatogenes]|uniref:hypothetical protein n=1 Tax=Nocardiopsis chromatogenes TaxID=280239 RepID=UPI0003467790|nr:hypothetical protein [Nocardiopsis chromatogenes]
MTFVLFVLPVLILGAAVAAYVFMGRRDGAAVQGPGSPDPTRDGGADEGGEGKAADGRTE